MRPARILAAAGALMLSAAPACAERVVSSLATHQVFITSQFVGLDLVLFGSVERDATTVPRRSGYDLVVTVSGPRESQVTRRKDRVLGIWVNVESREFINVPSYLAVLSTKPFDTFASADVQQRLQLGLDRTLLPQQIGVDVADVPRDDPFRMAFIRLKKERHLYLELTDAVTFLTPTLYRTTIPLPAVVPVGNYDVDLKLFADGALVGQANSAFEIVKAGFEQYVVTSATTHGLFYGLSTVMFALMTGWFASVVFRRD
ncbi:MAG: TIGR02186 family protein [Xanthobacteraceae bacterium]